MPNTKISEDPIATTLSGTEVIPLLQSAINKRTTIQDIIIDKKLISYNPTLSSLVDGNGNVLIDQYVSTILDLPSATDVNNTGRTITSLNPAGAVAGFFPTDMYCANSRWYTKNGRALLNVAYPKLRITFPAAAWNNTGLTVGSASAGAAVLLTGGAGHALTTANQITAGNTYIYISGSTGAGSLDWTVGWYKLIAITDVGNDLTVDRAYNSNLRQPIVADIGTEVPAARISIPPLSESGGFEIFNVVKNTVAANEHRWRIRYGAAGVATASGVEIFNVNDVAASIIAFRAGLQNTGSTTTNISLGPVTGSNSGIGASSATTYATPNISNGTANTDLLITAISGNGVDITMELVAYNIVWWY